MRPRNGVHIPQIVKMSPMFGRILAALALIGPPLIGLVAPALVLVALRKRRRSQSQADASRGPSPIALVMASVVWLLLCVATSKLLVSVAFGVTWGWAHAGRQPLISEQLTFLSYVAAGLVFLSACAFALNRLLLSAKKVG